MIHSESERTTAMWCQSDAVGVLALSSVVPVDVVPRRAMLPVPSLRSRPIWLVSSVPKSKRYWPEAPVERVRTHAVTEKLPPAGTAPIGSITVWEAPGDRQELRLPVVKA